MSLSAAINVEQPIWLDLKYFVSTALAERFDPIHL